MRVLELHASMRPIKRSEGRSSVQMAAYITRTSMEDERTGETFDHRKKGGVEFSGDHEVLLVSAQAVVTGRVHGARHSPQRGPVSAGAVAGDFPLVSGYTFQDT